MFNANGGGKIILMEGAISEYAACKATFSCSMVQLNVQAASSKQQVKKCNCHM
jgi:hypothetical protein